MRRLAIASLLIAACGGATASLDVRPAVQLSTSPDAMRAIGEIREAWMTPPTGWSTLRLQLSRFLERYGDDALAPIAHLYLANAEIALGDLPSAKAERALAGKLPPAGTLTDLDTVTRARIDRAEGRPEAALDGLRPLVGKAVDPIVRELLLAEVTLAAVDAHRDYEAIAYMDAWLRDTTDDRAEAVLGRIDETLAAMPASAIEGSLRAMRASPDSAYAAPLLQKMALRLAKVALETNDAQLAKWLLDAQGGAAHVSGDDARSLKDLATTLRGRRSVAGRSIGLVLPTSTAELRDAAADVARGVAFALDLPRNPGAPDDGVRLLTRSEGGGDTVEAAFEELVGEGASVILAGLDDAGTERARAWSEQNGVPMVLLGAPTTPGVKFAYALGEPVRHALEPLLAELARRKQGKVAVLAGTMELATFAAWTDAGLSLLPPTSCDPPLSRAKLPLADWKRDRVAAVLVSGSDACARAVMPVLDAGSLLALGPRPAAGVQGSTREVKVLTVQTGAYPLGAPGARVDARLASYKELAAHAPTWWTALGYDAATLARAATATLPLDETTLSTELTRRREVVRVGVEAARAGLWTSDSPGFEGSHALARKWQVVELPVRAPQ